MLPCSINFLRKAEYEKNILLNRLACAFLFLFILCAGCFPLPAVFHRYDYHDPDANRFDLYQESGDWVYILKDDHTVLIVDYTGNGGDVVIPSSIGGYPVTALGGRLFCWAPIHDVPVIRSVFIPETVTFIASFIFKWMDEAGGCNVETMRVAQSNPVYEIYDGGLYNKKEKSLHTCILSEPGLSGSFTVKDGTEILGPRSIKPGVFEEIYLPDTLKEIADSALGKETHPAALVMEIPRSVEKIPLDTVWPSGVSFSPDNQTYEVTGDCIYNKKTQVLLSALDTNQRTYAIKPGTRRIEDHAFEWCGSLESIDIPPTITAIGRDAFAGCEELSSVTLADGLKTIGMSAFQDCQSLKRIQLPETVVGIGVRAFEGCSGLAVSEIPAGVTFIGADAFPCEFSIAKGNRVYCITQHSLYNKMQQELHSVYSLPADGIYHIPSGTKIIGDNAFDCCSDALTAVTIPGSVTVIGSAAFSGCKKLTSITIPDSVVKIGGEAFGFCEKLASVMVPSSVADLASDFCIGADTVLTVNSANQVYEVRSGMLCNKKTKATLFMVTMTEDGIVTIPYGINAIGTNTFHRYLSSIRRIRIPSSVAAIENGTFGLQGEYDNFAVETDKGSFAGRWARGMRFPVTVWHRHRVTTNLRLRETEDLSGPVLVTMQQGANVKILHTGRKETIDGISGDWVQIEVQAGSMDKTGNTIPPGTEGWCFSGYLQAAD
jgi:hypothetical protein